MLLAMQKPVATLSHLPLRSLLVGCGYFTSVLCEKTFIWFLSPSLPALYFMSDSRMSVFYGQPSYGNPFSHPPPMPNPYPLPPAMFQMDPATFRRDFSNRLAELTVNSRPIIQGLSMMAHDYSRFAEIVAQCIEAHIRKVGFVRQLHALVHC